jgi:hypothetical protein
VEAFAGFYVFMLISGPNLHSNAPACSAGDTIPVRLVDSPFQRSSVVCSSTVKRDMTEISTMKVLRRDNEWNS